MPYDAGGNFTRVHNWQQDRDNGIRIMADRHDEEDDNLAGGLNQAFLRTGVVPMTGNLQMNGHRVLDVASGTLLQPGLTFELDNDTGLFQPGSGQLGIVVNGTQRGLFTDAGLQVTGDIVASGAANFPAGATLGHTLIYSTATDEAIELGSGRTTDGIAYLDFHGTVGSDYDARIMRSAGANANLLISNKGAASLILNSETAGGNILFQTLGTNRVGIWDTGDVQFYNNVSVAGNVTTAGRETVNIIDTQAIEFPRHVGGVFQGMVYADQGSLILSANRHVAGQEKYWTFHGATGNIISHAGGTYWHSLNDGAGSGLDADLLDGLQSSYFQPALGFTPVQQGTGIGQNNYNTVKIGWSPESKLKATVDNSDIGYFGMVGVDNNWAATQSFWGNPTGIACQTNIWCGGSISSVGGISAQAAITTSGAGGMFMFQHRDNAGISHGWYATGNYARLWRNDDGDQYEFHPTAFRCPIDQKADCGGPSQRWFTVWCRTSTMSTSDAREKDWRGGLDATELAVSADLGKEIGIYRWLSDIEKDGDGAKLNCGWTAQRLIEVFNAHGLDALNYGFLTHSTWEESSYEGPDGPIITPAGDRYSVMLPDLIAFMLAGQEQRIAALEARL